MFQTNYVVVIDIFPHFGEVFTSLLMLTWCSIPDRLIWDIIFSNVFEDAISFNRPAARFQYTRRVVVLDYTKDLMFFSVIIS